MGLQIVCRHIFKRRISILGYQSYNQSDYPWFLFWLNAKEFSSRFIMYNHPVSNFRQGIQDDLTSRDTTEFRINSWCDRDIHHKLTNFSPHCMNLGRQLLPDVCLLMCKFLSQALTFLVIAEIWIDGDARAIVYRTESTTCSLCFDS